MKLSIFPNWCKWISLAMLVQAILLLCSVFFTGTMDGYNEQALLHNPKAVVTPSGQPPLNNPLPLIGEWLAILAIIVFILSKDKRDDEYTNIARAKALLLALFISAFVLFFLLLFQRQLYGIELLILIFITYISIFKVMKMRDSFTSSKA